MFGSIPQCFNPSKQIPKLIINNQQKKQAQKMDHFMRTTKQFAHTVMYCRQKNQQLTVSQHKILTNQKKKYTDYVKKNFRYKIPEQFLSKKIYKQKISQWKKQQIAQQKFQLQEFDKKKVTRRPRGEINTNLQAGQPRKRIKAVQERVQAQKNSKKATKTEKKKTQKKQQNNEIPQKQAPQQFNQQQPEMEIAGDSHNFQMQEDLQNHDLSDFDHDQ